MQLKIIKTFLYFISYIDWIIQSLLLASNREWNIQSISYISYIIWIYHVYMYIRVNVHVCCYLLYSEKTAILTKHIWQYKQFYVHVYFLFLLCSSNLVWEAIIIVGISWSHYCYIAKAQVLRYYDTIALATPPRTPLRIRHLSYTHSQWVFDRWQLLRWGLGVAPAIISL